MAVARLSAYLLAIKSVSEERCAEIREIFTDTIPIESDANRRPALDARQTLRLILLSSAVCGIELCYAAETAFVSPILLRLGIPTVYATLTWCLSPLLGLVVGPVLGSLSDRCQSSLGRRRPFILLLSVGIVLGLILVPHGQRIGSLLVGRGGNGSTDTAGVRNATGVERVRYSDEAVPMTSSRSEIDERFIAAPTAVYSGTTESWLRHRARESSSETSRRGDVGTSRLSEWNDSPASADCTTPHRPRSTPCRPKRGRDPTHKSYKSLRQSTTTSQPRNTTVSAPTTPSIVSRDVTIRAWQPSLGVVLTVIGVVLLDCCCDACQSPCRTYLLDVSQPENQAIGLTTFTVMAGLGGSVGYLLGGVIDWKRTDLGQAFGGHDQFVFGVVTVAYVIAVTITVCSVREVPFNELDRSNQPERVGKYRQFSNDDSDPDAFRACYGSSDPSESFNAHLSVERDDADVRQVSPHDHPETSVHDERTVLLTEISLKTYLLSVLRMPRSLVVLCLTNFFCWASLVCYSLYFTDFVGQSVYGGDPRAPAESRSHELYESGVRAGAVGMSVYSLSCSIYSLNIEKLVKRYGARRVYIVSQLVYTVGASLIALTRHHVTIVVLSVCPGIMYATLFTMPYLLVAHYHSTQTFEDRAAGDKEPTPQHTRGLGTDIAVVSSMVFIAQFLVSAFMGAIVELFGSPAVVMVAAAILSLCGVVSASRVTYLGM